MFKKLFVVFAIVFAVAVVMFLNNPADAAILSWYGYCYDGSTYLANVDITIQKTGGGSIYQTTTNAQGYYSVIIGSSGDYQMMAEDESGRVIIEYDNISSPTTSKRHDFDFTNVPY